MKTKVSVFSFKNYKDYLREVVAENIANRGKSFGYRYLSTHLEWPSTYLNDVVTGRKKLSATKTLEIALFFNLSALEQEYLSLMVLNESENEILRDHASKSLSEWDHVKLHHVENPSAEFHFNILVPFLEGLMKLMKPEDLQDKNILKAVRETPISDEFSDEEILITLNIMTKKKRLSKVGETYKIEKSSNQEIFGESVSDPSSPFRMRSLFKRYATSWKLFLENRKNENFHLKSSSIVLTLSQLKVLARKVDELRDLTTSFHHENIEKEERPADLRLIQFNFNLLEIRCAENKS